MTLYLRGVWLTNTHTHTPGLCNLVQTHTHKASVLHIFAFRAISRWETENGGGGGMQG